MSTQYKWLDKYDRICRLISPNDTLTGDGLVAYAEYTDGHRELLVDVLPVRLRKSHE